jgi:hypothetical protein
MALFGDVRHSGQMNDVVNFETFARAFVLMFRLATGSGWNSILQDLSIQPPFCDMDYENLPHGNCGDPVAASIYIVVFAIISSLVIIQMYVAVILESFREATIQEEELFTANDVSEFYSHWARFDKKATQFIKFDQLLLFVLTLKGKLGIEHATSKLVVEKLQIPLYGDELAHCVDVLNALMKYHRSHSSGNLPHEEVVLDVLNRTYSQAFPGLSWCQRLSSAVLLLCPPFFLLFLMMN